VEDRFLHDDVLDALDSDLGRGTKLSPPGVASRLIDRLVGSIV
jgi:hypothetical protein